MKERPGESRSFQKRKRLPGRQLRETKRFFGRHERFCEVRAARIFRSEGRGFPPAGKNALEKRSDSRRRVARAVRFGRKGCGAFLDRRRGTFVASVGSDDLDSLLRKCFHVFLTDAAAPKAARQLAAWTTVPMAPIFKIHRVFT